MQQPTTGYRSFGATDAMLLTMATIWAINFSVVKFATGVLEPLAFTGLRVGVAALVLVTLAVTARAGMPRGRDLGTLLMLGAIGHGLYQVFFIEGVARTRAGNAALIVAASPAVIAVASRLRGIEKLRRRAVSGVVLSFAGVALIILGSGDARVGAAGLAGSFLVFGAVLLWTVFAIGLQPFTATMSPLTLSATTIVGGLLPLMLVAAKPLARTDWASLPPNLWLATLYSSVGAMVIAYLFWYRGMKTIGPTRTAVYVNVQPMIALLAAWAMLGEMPTLWQAVGTATILGGVFLTRS